MFIENGKIVNSSSKHLLIHADRGAGESTRIHGLHDSNLAGANSVAKVLMLLAKQIVNVQLIFHHAPLDVKFLQRASKEVFRCPLLFTYFDTMEIEKRRLNLQGKQGGLQLQQCRERYGLQKVTQHNAEADALATAELFLAQVHHMGDINHFSLSQLPLHCS